MKPHIRKIYGLWFCHAKGNPAGIGYTPLGAYDDWLRLALRA